MAKTIAEIFGTPQHHAAVYDFNAAVITEKLQTAKRRLVQQKELYRDCIDGKREIEDCLKTCREEDRKCYEGMYSGYLELLTNTQARIERYENRVKFLDRSLAIALNHNLQTA